MGGVDLSAGLTLTGTTHNNAGDYPSDSWNFAGGTNYNDASGALHDAIAKATATINVTAYTAIYDSNAHTATGTATGVGGANLAGQLMLSGTTHTNAGDYPSDSWSFAGGTNYNDASGTVHNSIAQASSATTVTCPTNVTYNATAQTPCTASVTGAGLNQVLPITYSNNTNVGTAMASASFAGDSNHTGSNGSKAFTITKASSTTAVVSSANPSTLNQSVTFTTTVSPQYAGTPTGTVTFTYSNSVLSVSGTLGTASLSGGQATLTTSSLPVNANTVTATYSGDGNFTGSNGSTTQNVTYKTGGLCVGDVGHAIRQPINSDGSSVFKMGSTVPTKFAVCDVSGISIGTPGVVVGYGLVAAASSPAITVDEDVYSTTPDAAFRWDPTGQQWIFNQSTKNNGSLNKTGTTYFFAINLKDGSSIFFHYGLK